MVAKQGECPLRIVGGLEQIQVTRIDHSVLHEGVEIQDVLPKGCSVEEDEDPSLDLSSLREHQDLRQLIQGSQASRKYDERPCQVGEPELAHEEVVKLEIERRGDEWIGALFEGQSDVETDRFPLGVGSSPVGGLHNPGSSPRTDDEALRRAWKSRGPFGELPSKSPSFLIVAALWSVLSKSSRAEEHHGVVNSFPAQLMQRFQVLCQQPQRSGISGGEECVVLQREMHLGVIRGVHQCPLSMSLSNLTANKDDGLPWIGARPSVPSFWQSEEGFSLPVTLYRTCLAAPSWNVESVEMTSARGTLDGSQPRP